MKPTGQMLVKAMRNDDVDLMCEAYGATTEDISGLLRSRFGLAADAIEYRADACFNFLLEVKYPRGTVNKCREKTTEVSGLLRFAAIYDNVKAIRILSDYYINEEVYEDAIRISARKGKISALSHLLEHHGSSNSNLVAAAAESLLMQTYDCAFLILRTKDISINDVKRKLEKRYSAEDTPRAITKLNLLAESIRRERETERGRTNRPARP